jgi:hypothetical protein
MNLALVYALGGKMPEALAETEKSTKLNPPPARRPITTWVPLW